MNMLSPARLDKAGRSGEKGPMRPLPFVFACQSELTRAAQAAAEDAGRRILCVVCGGRILIRPEKPEQTVRCPHCWRRQRVTREQAPPWRLSETAMLALRQTRRWPRAL
jgi:DNA-directed RNA polymerase subunit RPC12/RpoP